MTINHRIGFVIGQLSHGGAERQLTEITSLLKLRSNYIPVVFCLSPYTNPYGDELINRGVELHIPDGHLRPLIKLIWLIRKAKTSNCKLLYGFLNVGNVYAGIAAIFLHLPLVGSVRNVDKTLSWATKMLSGLLCRHAAVVIGNSKSCIEFLQQDLHVRHGRTVIIPNLVNELPMLERERIMIRQDWNVTTESVIGTVAVMRKQKRPDLFVDVFAELRSRGNTSHFVWVGDGAERSQILRKLETLDPSSSHLLHLEGFKTNVGSYLAAFDIFVLLSDFEGLPNALLEAMAAGKPCVVTDAPGIVDIFTEESGSKPLGVIARRGDAKQIAELIIQLQQNPQLTDTLAQNARDHIHKTYSAEEILKSYTTLFDSLLG